MRILITYATTDGQTRKIARRIGDICMNQGHSVELLPAAEAEDIDLFSYGAVVLAGSVHLGGLQKPISDFAATHANLLNKMKTLLVVVSLSAAGQSDADWKGLEKITAEFTEATGFTPSRTEHVAGAFRFSQYDVFRAWAMKRIAAKKDPEVDGSKDREYTDWVKLGRDVTDWITANVES